MTSEDASTAVRRFGLGPKPADLKKIAGDPRGWVLSTIASGANARITGHDLETAQENFARMVEAQREIEAARKAAPAGSGPAPAPVSASPAKPADIRKEVFGEEVAARFSHAVTTDIPLVERLVLFWSNHFSVSALKGQRVRVMVGAYEREAIRPHVLGRFADMLLAVEQHPAMLLYLDNAQSIGPSSNAGLKRGKGLNENLAREILELHTLGVDGGYTQADVTAFAKILTGWTVQGGEPHPRFRPGDFRFTPERHEPGQHMIMGRRYGGQGEQAGRQVLLDLARHQATARHIARKLARHFVGDHAAPELVRDLERAFRDTEGDLRVVAEVLVRHPAAWNPGGRKVVPPYDFLVSLARAFGARITPQETVRLTALLGQPVWQPPSPKGWPDEDDAWMGPSAVRERLRIAERVSRDIDASADPRGLARDLLAGPAANHVRQVVARAETREQGLQLLVMCPEFLKR